MIKERATVSRPISFLLVISIFILFTVAVATSGLYFYKGIIIKQIAEKNDSLIRNKNDFETTKIEELQILDKRLRTAKEILEKHIAITPIFKALQELTMKTVRYTRFEYTLGAERDPKINVKMSGVAMNYGSIALQSDLFSKNKNLKEPVFSDLSLDDKGNVIFNLEFTVDSTFVDYKQMLLTETQEGDSSSDSDSSPGA